MGNDVSLQKTLKTFELGFSLKGKGVVILEAESYSEAEKMFLEKKMDWVSRAKLKGEPDQLLQIKQIKKQDEEIVIDLDEIIIKDENPNG